MDPYAGLTASEAKRHMIAEIHEDHGETITAHPLIRDEFGLLYRDMDELLMYRFRPWLQSIERVARALRGADPRRPVGPVGGRLGGQVLEG